MLYPVNSASAAVLDKIAVAPRMSAIDTEWTSGWNETTDRKLGLFEPKPSAPSQWTDAILQGPHLTVATPVNQEPDVIPGRYHLYVPIDFDTIGADIVPRTNYQLAKPYDEFIDAYPKWHDQPSSNHFRLAWRAMADSATVRTLHSALIPPGPTHLYSLFSISAPDLRDIAIFAGFTSSIPADFLVKVMGVANINIGILGKIPHLRNHPLETQLLLRTLRLNCLVQPYLPLWEHLYTSSWQQDSWVSGIGVAYSGREQISSVYENWNWATPLRRAADRRQALIEIDAIVAVMLGITVEELLTIYRTQFPVLQKYERDALYDATGRQLPGKLASEYRKKGFLKPADLTVDGVTYQEPFVGVDREHDMTLAHKHFSDLLL